MYWYPHIIKYFFRVTQINTFNISQIFPSPSHHHDLKGGEFLCILRCQSSVRSGVMMIMLHWPIVRMTQAIVCIRFLSLYWNDWVVNNTDTVTIGLVNIIVVLCYYYNGLPGYFLTLKYAALHSERCSFEKWGCCWVSIESFPVTLSLIWIKSEWT